MTESSCVYLIVESAVLAEKLGAAFVDPAPVELMWPQDCKKRLLPESNQAAA